MASWLDKARDNMLRYSSGQSWPAVMKEWSVTGGFIDSHSDNRTCELCDNEGLRYQFQITNSLTHFPSGWALPALISLSLFSWAAENCLEKRMKPKCVKLWRPPGLPHGRNARKRSWNS